MVNKETAKMRIAFAAIDPYIETNIPSPTEKKVLGRDYVEWGDRNTYPDYLLELSKTVPTLHSVIGGTVDFIVGNAVSILPLEGMAYAEGRMNTRGDTIRDQVEDLARDYETYGGFALQVVRSLTGQVAEIYYIDIRFLRSNKENTVFYYSEKWKEGRRKMVEYPAFIPGLEKKWSTFSDEQKDRNASSILFVKNNHSQVYPLPVYCAAVKDCEIERCIDDFHLNAINNGFVSSMIVNFNNGYPGEQMAKQIEKEFNEKFAGHQNAGRITFSWNANKDNATTLTEPKVEDFGDRYKALSSHSRQQIFTAFRANPNLFGIPTENLGFSQEEYESAFRLYNRTCVRPVQDKICDAYDRIYGQTGVLTITPFSLTESAGERNVQ